MEVMAEDKSLNIEESLTSQNEMKQHLKKYGLLGFLFILNAGYLVLSLILTPEDPLVRIFICGGIGTKIVLEVMPTHHLQPIFQHMEIVCMVFMKEGMVIKVVLEGLLLVGILLVAVFTFTDSELTTSLQRCQSLLGLASFVGGLALTSRSFQKIPWKLVVPGILIQVLVGLYVMQTLVGKHIFLFISNQCVALLGFAMKGSGFVFGSLAQNNVFAFIVLPAILFFSSLMQVLYYLGVMQWLIGMLASFFKVTMGSSGCESTAAAAPFIGMIESTLTVKPFFEDMTQSELHQFLTSGLSNIAASVLIAFIRMGIYADTMITSCVMLIPCSLSLSKLRYPETEGSRIKYDVNIDGKKQDTNLIHAAANGASQGVTICMMVAGTLLPDISLLNLTDNILGYFRSFICLPNLSLFLVGSYIFTPFAWLIGVPWRECQVVGQLMAMRMITNEFVAFTQLAELQASHELSACTGILETYALCGFANFASVGIQLSCIGGMAPSCKADIAKLAVSAVITGTMCIFVSVAIAGILI
ncbi:hypothetical protein DSO57_1010584 [Entomophthora muscae]|uniref:Uncharacterized protein n=1 Tax=Entomophthora muscae TaxID=34485 RepID=A0ACC2UFH0_9FUNG|nr:hypothetical protein DSO57_1010584 [Entomophthora muscae]